MRTQDQAVIMELLINFNCLRRDQIEKYMLNARDSGVAQVEHMLAQLRYLSEIEIRRNLVMLPGRRENEEVITAFDIMLEITAGTRVSVNRGAPPYVMFYTVSGRKNAGVYGIIYVAQGKELRIASRLHKNSDSGLTLIIILESLKQQQYFAAVENVYFAIHDGTKYRYFTGGD